MVEFVGFSCVSSVCVLHGMCVGSVELDVNVLIQFIFNICGSEHHAL